MKTKTVKTIFTNLIFVIGVVLVIVGFSRGLLAVGRIIVFDKYPLPSFEEGRCEIRPAPVEGREGLEVQDREKCLAGIEEARRVRKFEDIVNSISFLITGGFLVFFFRGFIFDRKR